MTLGEQLASAIDCHKSGDLRGAEAAYQAILDREPASCDARHLLGLVAHQQGDNQRAASLIREALRLNPNAPAFHCNLGVVLKAQGQLDQAEGSYRRALQLAPGYAEAHCNLGNVLRKQGKLEEAEVELRHALRIKPHYADALSSLGATLRRQGRAGDAIAACRQAVELKPTFAEAHINLGNALRDKGQLPEAVEVLCRAAELRPQDARVFNNLGNAYQDLGQLAEAIACYERAIALMPDYAEAYANLGAAFRQQGDLDAAFQAARTAIDTDPELPEGHWNLALFLLSRGEFDEGWREYEWRWRLAGTRSRPFDVPAWDGQYCGGTLLVHAEQGIGDTLQFIRYLPSLAERCERLVFECPPTLVKLVKQTVGIDAVISRGETLPHIDAQIPLLSLPRLFETSLTTIPSDIPYLRPDPSLAECWEQRLAGGNGRQIGLCWQGSPTFTGDRLRSIPLRCYAPLAQITDLRFVSLQKEHGLDQLRSGSFPVPVLDISDDLTDFSETAAVISNLDLVVTSDTSVAHMAGALGIPVWLALQYAPDWRWLRDRDDSPWYPTMRLFRQSKLNDWDTVFERIAVALENDIALAGSHRNCGVPPKGWRRAPTVKSLKN